MSEENNEERAKEFVENLGHGKSMVEIEQEKYMSDEEIKKATTEFAESKAERKAMKENYDEAMKKAEEDTKKEWAEEEAENEKGEFEEQCRVYAEKRKAIEDFNSKVKESTMTIDTEIKKLNDERQKILEQFKDESAVINTEKERLSNLIIDDFPIDEKTVSFDGVGRFTKRVNKSIEILDKDKLLNILVEKKMLQNE